MINQIENNGWNQKNDIINSNITVPEAAFKGYNSVSRQLREIKSREAGLRVESVMTETRD